MTFKTNLPVMVFIDVKICLPTKKKIQPNKPPEQPKSFVDTMKKKPAYLNLKNFVQANLNLKICISGYLNQSPPYMNIIFSFQTSKIPFLPVMVITYKSFLFTSACHKTIQLLVYLQPLLQWLVCSGLCKVD